MFDGCLRLWSGGVAVTEVEVVAGDFGALTGFGGRAAAVICSGAGPDDGVTSNRATGLGGGMSVL